MALYKGYSSFEFQRAKEFTLTDIDLVKLDLLNTIFTPVGSRVMLPTFGTLIPSMTFEPLDDDTIETVVEELSRTFAFDPRVEEIAINVSPDFDTNSLTVAARLFYVELNLVDDFELNIQFEK